MDTLRDNCKSYMKIFRPWDVEEQDSTISTTSQDDIETDSRESCVKVRGSGETFRFDEIKSQCYENKQNCDPEAKNFHVTSRAHAKPDKDKKQRSKSLKSQDAPAESVPFVPYYEHPNLAHTLGLNPADSLFLESVAQGYAIEEYARIMSQEQHAKMMHGRKQRPKKYKCPHCDVGFSNNGQLKGHIRIHTGERPFQCDEKNCGKTFTRNEELTRHKRIHSGLRPFPCNQCGKRFGRKDHLKKHTRTHLQQRGVYAVPLVFPMDAWTATPYPFIPMYGY